MKKIFSLLFLLFILALTAIYRNSIVEYITENFIYKKQPVTIINNEYAVNYKYNYVSTTRDFNAKNKQQILDIFYTYLNSGTEEFYFYCDYDNCENDISYLTKNKIFSNINNFVSPYNSYNQIHIKISSWGKVDVTVDKSYSENEIKAVNSKINEITQKMITPNMSDIEKIKAFHDYIINNTKYDSEYLKSGFEDLRFYSHRATGALIYSKSLCGGYAHSIALFLNELNIPNYRISSDEHVWNLVYLDGKWYHLDLTWDDPVTNTNKDILIDDYFLIDSNKLSSFNTGYHAFDASIYSEAL